VTVDSEQTPDEQVSPIEHAVAQEPQLYLSLERSTHAPLQLVWPAAHVTVDREQTPEEQVCPVEHAVAQEPQLSLSLKRSTHAPLHAVMPVAHVVAAGLQTPLEQTSPVGQSLSAEQAVVLAVQAPLTHTCPVAQSLSAEHAAVVAPEMQPPKRVKPVTWKVAMPPETLDTLICFAVPWASSSTASMKSDDADVPLGSATGIWTVAGIANTRPLGSKSTIGPAAFVPLGPDVATD
jgi:hypothetical protein